MAPQFSTCKTIYLEQKHVTTVIRRQIYFFQQKYDPNYGSSFLNEKAQEIFDLEREVWTFDLNWSRFEGRNYSDDLLWENEEGEYCRTFLLDWARRITNIRRDLFDFTTTIEGIQFRGHIRIKRKRDGYVFPLENDEPKRI